MVGELNEQDDLIVMRRWTRILLGAAAVVLAQPVLVAPALSAPGTAGLLWQSSNPFSELVGERRERRAAPNRGGKVERYVLASDDRALLLQSQSRTARVKFLCGPRDRRVDCTLDPELPAPEIYLLTVTRGPRGDLIYKDADGDTLLRLASYGGATVFWPGAAQGNAASKSFGETSRIMLAEADMTIAERRAKAASAVVSAATGAPVIFDIPASLPGGEAGAAVLADAVVRAAVGVMRVADDPTGAGILADQVRRVVFETGAAPGLRVEDDRVIVTIVPDQDIAGRPSSRAVERFLENSL